MSDYNRVPFMKQLVSFLFWQELYYGIFIVIVGMAIGFDKGFDAGLRTILYLFIFLQLIIFWMNRNVIKAFLNPEIKDKK